MKKLKSGVLNGKCLLCGEHLSRGGAKFCSDRCRMAYHNAKSAVTKKCPECRAPMIARPGDTICPRCAWSAYSKAFIRTNKEMIEWFKDHSICFYCGELADEVEHVMPRHTKIRTFTVPSCGECNRFASGAVFMSVHDKMQYIRDRRAKKYRKLLTMPEWTEDELDDLTGNLKRHVRAVAAASEIVKSQLSWDVSEVLCKIF